MYRPTRMLICALMLGALAACARAENAAIRNELNAQYEKFNRSLIKKDIKTMFDMLTPDATVREQNGQTMNREQLRRMMQQTLANLNIEQSTNTIDKLTVKGSMATVEVTAKTRGKMTGQDGKPVAVGFISKSRDFWVKTGAGWKIKKSESLAENMTREDRPTSHPAPARKR